VSAPGRVALRAVALAVAWLSGVGLAPAQDAEPELLLRERRLGVMGTDLHLEVLGPDEAVLEQALDAAEAELRRVEDVFTTWRTSPLNDLNDAAGAGPQPASAELIRLLLEARELGALTDGAFDMTFAGVGKLWDFKRKPPVLPSDEEIRVALQRVDYRRVQLDPEAGTVELPEGFRIGLGGIAKGYGVDRAMQKVMQLGVRHAMVNAGGDLKALGRKRDELWKIAIRHPRDRERILAVLPVSNTCVVTSGDYERFFEHEGQRYHHILDPRTGRPSTGCMSATVVAPEAAFADALATALCVLEPEEGLALVERMRRVECLLVDIEGEVHVSTGLRGKN